MKIKVLMIIFVAVSVAFSANGEGGCIYNNGRYVNPYGFHLGKAENSNYLYIAIKEQERTHIVFPQYSIYKIDTISGNTDILASSSLWLGNVYPAGNGFAYEKERFLQPIGNELHYYDETTGKDTLVCWQADLIGSDANRLIYSYDSSLWYYDILIGSQNRMSYGTPVAYCDNYILLYSQSNDKWAVYNINTDSETEELPDFFTASTHLVKDAPLQNANYICSVSCNENRLVINHNSIIYSTDPDEITLCDVSYDGNAFLYGEDVYVYSSKLQCLYQINLSKKCANSFLIKAIPHK